MWDGPCQFGSRSRSTGPFECCVLEGNDASTAKEMSGLNGKGPLFEPAGVTVSGFLISELETH